MTLLTLTLACSSVAAEPLPWQVNTPICTVQKDLYEPHTHTREAELVQVLYVGPGLERREVHAREVSNDVGGNIRARWSADNGRTWSEYTAIQTSNNLDYKGVTVWEGECVNAFDPASGRLVQAWLRQIVQGGLYHCFTYWRVSADQGRTWTEPVQFRYEDGDPFDPNEPLKPTFLNRNEGYPGSNLLVRADGSLVYCLAHANAPGDPRNDQRPWRMGSVLFLGRWHAAKQTYEWRPGGRTEISPEWSARGLMEPEVAELRDGRLLVVWRASTHGWDGTVAKLPGRKFFSLSADGGQTLSPPAEWQYDDGTPFYSPSSYHRMLRHSLTGKLYWIGNISAVPPVGNSPRYPLVIAEVDEAKAALKKATVTAIDDRQLGQPEIELSNFALLENRETHQLELYLAGYGQNPDGADCLRYVLTLTAVADAKLPPPRRCLSPWVVYQDVHTIDSLKPNADLLSSISVAGGTPKAFVDGCHALGIQVYGLVGGHDGAAFETPEARTKLIGEYLARCRAEGLDGIDLDFESLDAKCRDAYSALLREAAKALRADGRKLSMCVSYVMCTWRSNAAPAADPEAGIDGGWYDAAVVGKACDLVRVMCYDMISPSSTAVGPVSTRPWARDAMRYWLSHVPKAKLVMGLPAYSRDYALTGKREIASPYAPAPEVAAATAVQRLWLPYECVHQYRYTDAAGAEHLFYASDTQSTEALLGVARELGVAVGFWHYASVPGQTWAAVRRWARQ
ncbi:MAG: hypothetical protein HYU66_14705 [Armatimonadetes bacterium]|nr:hypothetical protein [Armatimonadota bacterium]